MSTSRLPSEDSASPKSKRVPRPPNPFILFRRDTLSQGNIAKTFIDPSTGFTRPRGQPDLSREIGVLWHKAPDDVKSYYREQADQHLYEHREKHPGYKFKPQKSKKSEKDSRTMRTHGTTSSAKTSTASYPTDSRVRPSSTAAAISAQQSPFQWHPSAPPSPARDQIYTSHRTPYYDFPPSHVPTADCTPQFDPAAHMQAAYYQPQQGMTLYPTYSPQFPGMQDSGYRSPPNVGIDPRVLTQPPRRWN